MILEIKNIEGKVIQKIPRPNYIQAGSVPYLAWGFGLTPVYRDRAYFILAITWGNMIQLALVNEDCTEREFQFNPRSKIFYDGFYISDTPLASCFFISESILVVVSNNHQIKVLYTQNFSPGIVDEELFEPLDKARFDFDRS